ncbi:DUF1003 domain-containing protein [Brachybacterium huguangmaarense]|uniref:DUF1003 domain-containing protein n=1 Tax=Brachybacterium huguangmaarense TaxID=1652028 RepID=A0ABY6G0T6_9MICO|nr:DUF1003 domain-containing protein [Brachybacterium huguangmaarense]UYG16810.1 DUF1003 domain-containing protein [Brachybacterium huguangmaarense]
MAENTKASRRRDPKPSSTLDDPAPRRRKVIRNPISGDAFGRGAEAFARFMGTPLFLVGMTIFCAVWLIWNSVMPESVQFDPRALNFTLLTLILSLQASYAAPLLLLSDNRQADRDRVQAEQDRQSNDRNHATTDFITREIASLRLALNDMATRDFVRGELRDLLEELEETRGEAVDEAGSVLERPAPLPEREDLRRMLHEELASVLAERDAARVGALPASPTDPTMDARS